MKGGDMPALDLIVPPKYITYDELIPRAKLNGASKQPRFQGNDYGFGGFYPILRQVANTREPEYLPGSIPRDRWLQEFRFVESHIAGSSFTGDTIHRSHLPSIHRLAEAALQPDACGEFPWESSTISDLTLPVAKERHPY